MDEKTELLLNEYLDGMLSEVEQREVESLLAESAEARAYLAELEQLFGTLTDLESVPLARDLTAEVMTQIELPTASLWSNWWLIAQVAGTAVLLLFAWPILQMGLAEITASFSPATTSVSLTFITDFWQQVRGWSTAVSTPAPLPTFELSPVQLSLILGSAVLLWLLTNGYLLTNESE